eukprot:272663_1
MLNHKAKVWIECLFIYQNPVFAHDQLYTGLSRVRDPQKLNILIVNTNEHGYFEEFNGWYTRNVVYQQALHGIFNNDNNSLINDLEDEFNIDFDLDNPLMYY